MTNAVPDPFNCFREVDEAALSSGAAFTVGVKDSMDVARMHSMHGSAVFGDSLPAAQDALVVARLRKAGATIVGKTNMTELACGTDGRNPHFGDVANPLDPSRHSGGSSSGSAAAVASGMVRMALGSDTGGSIRVPAAACGLVGLKPTFGRVPNDGMSVCSSHLDHIGPITKTIADARWCLETIEDAGWAQQTCDPTTTTVGVLRGPFVHDATRDVLDAFADALDALTALGSTLVDVDLSVDLDGAAMRHATALSRDLFDEYGHILNAAPAGDVGDELQRWADEYIDIDDAAYRAALREQARLRSLLAREMRGVDVLVCPTMRTGVCTFTEVQSQPRELRTGNLEIFNMTGQPSLTIPWGIDLNGLPLGLLLTGRPGEDHLILDLGEKLLKR